MFIILIILAVVLGSPKITVNNPWFRPGAAGMNSALYMEITNNQDVSDTLYDVKSGIAKITEMHETYKSGEMMGMRRTKYIVIAPHSTVKFQPGGHHIMLISLVKQYKEGSEDQVRLFFRKAGEVKVKAVVKK